MSDDLAQAKRVSTLSQRIAIAVKRREKADANLRAVLAEARQTGATVRQLADATGMPPMTVWRWSGGAETVKGNVLAR